MTIIKGSDVLGMVNDIPIFCGLDLTFTEDKDTVERSGPFGGPGLWTYSALVKRGWSVEISGLTKINPSDGQEDYFTMISDPFSYGYQTITVFFTDQDGNNISIAGVMFLKNSSITGPAVGFAQASVTFIGTGEYILSTDGSGSGGSVPVCVPVGGGAFAPPDATLNSLYSYDYTLTGTLPFTLGAFTIPGWMSLAIVGDTAHFGGTPISFGDVGPAFLDITFQNDCGTINFPEVEIEVLEDGRNVFVINNSSSDIDIQNDNGHTYTFLASNGSDGNLKMQSDTVNITSIVGAKNYEFLQSLPSTVINSGTTAGGTITTSDLSITNYLRFSD